MRLRARLKRIRKVGHLDERCDLRWSSREDRSTTSTAPRGLLVPDIPPPEAATDCHAGCYTIHHDPNARSRTHNEMKGLQARRNGLTKDYALFRIGAFDRHAEYAGVRATVGSGGVVLGTRDERN